MLAIKKFWMMDEWNEVNMPASSTGFEYGLLVGVLAFRSVGFVATSAFARLEVTRILEFV